MLLTFFLQKSPTISIRLCCLLRKKKQINLYYFTYFYMIIYDFINCPAFVDIKQTALWISNRVNIIRETFVFYALLLVFFFAFLHWIKVCSCCFRQVFFFHLGGKKKYRWSSCAVSIGWEFAWADSALVVLQRWLFKKVWL